MQEWGYDEFGLKRQPIADAQKADGRAWVANIDLGVISIEINGDHGRG